MLFRNRDKNEVEKKVDSHLRKLELTIQGMNCSGCASNIELSIRRQKGVVSAKIDYSRSRGTILYNPQVTSKEQLTADPIFREPSQFAAEIVDGRELRDEKNH